MNVHPRIVAALHAAWCCDGLPDDGFPRPARGPAMITLRDLAAAATPGPWALDVGEPDRLAIGVVRWRDGEAEDICWTQDGGDPAMRAQSEADAAYIAACSPDRILALLAAGDTLAELLLLEHGPCAVGCDSTEALAAWREATR